MKSFSLMESNKRLFSPFKDRILIVDLLMLWTVFWVCVAMSYALLVRSGTLGFKGSLNSFAVNVLTQSRYFWLRTSFPRDSLYLLWYSMKSIY